MNILILIILLMTVIIFYICSIYTYNKKIKILNLENKNLLSLNEEMHLFKHDFQNIIQAFGGYIWANDINGLKNYYSQIFTNCSKINTLSKLNSDLINNPALYSIICKKFDTACDKNIQFNVDIMADLNEIKFPTFELSRILGILLDNAIEAANSCNEKTVNLVFRKTKQKQILLVENTYANPQLCIEDIFEKNFSTKNEKSGLGLWEVKKLLNRYSNLNLYTSTNGKYFSQQLEINIA